MYTFELPEIGEGVLEGELVKWLVDEGESISEDQPVCEVMTDKANVEISVRKGGTVVKLYGEEGDVIKIHAPLMDIDESGAPAKPKAAEKKDTPAPAPKAAPTPVSTPVPTPVVPAPVVSPPVMMQTSSPVSRAKTLASPAVRNAARKAGLDINTIPGTGKDGRVTRDDVAAFSNGASSAPAMPKVPVAIPQVAAVPSGAEKRVKIIGLRRKIAKQMQLSAFTAPHFTYVEEIDVTDLVAMRKALKAPAAEMGVALTFVPFIMKALSIIFRQFPNLNGNIVEEPLTLVVKGDVNIGVAVDAPAGLFVPVVKNVEQKSIMQIAAELSDLAARTRSGKISAEELQGGTFTVTSVGNIGGMFATPIINHPEVAIMGVNQIKKRPVVIDGEIVIRDMIYLSPSFDHRVIDGAVGARFVSALKVLLENPGHLLMELK
jgi:pyruvate dehydrogenase E2 component (dihydrolipoamide acetyltransferase)